MARLIPAFMDEHTPPGERDVFNMLSAGIDEWVVLHSLDLAPWNRGLRTEIDFVAIVPDLGILCIEVKSHHSITFDGNYWSPPEIRRSPFKQAADGRHTLYRRLRELAPQFRTIPIVHLCIFPNALFDIQPNLSVSQWELIDSRTFRSFKNAYAFCDELKARILMSIDADGNLERLGQPLSCKQVQTIVDCCMPIQKRRPDAREEIKRREYEIDLILREQQKPVLQLAEVNNRIIVAGAAGTGKTLIAMEVARRRAESGERVALLCFNQLVGRWIKEKIKHVKPELPNIIVGRTIQVLAELTGIDIPESPNKSFWDMELPAKLEEKLTDPDMHANAPFDYLVLDEAQDVLARPALWECLLHFLIGGVDGGKFALFGDFEHQVLGERKLLNETLETITRKAQPARWRLSENCRNYSIIGETAVLLSGFDQKTYTGYMRQGGSVSNYNIHFYSSDEEQVKILLDVLSDFKQKGYRPEEITILSFLATETVAATYLIQRGYKLIPAWHHGRFTHYCTVHSFKGLENKIIILTDVVPNGAEFHRDLFYIGMTRATESIRVFCSSECKETLIGWLTKGGQHVGKI